MKTDKVTLFLISLILLAFAVGSYRVDKQAHQINGILDAQQSLVFAFQNVGNSQPATFLVTCTLEKDKKRYACSTQQVLPTTQEGR